MKFYTVEQVAEILQVSEPTVRKLIASGELRAARVRHQYRISQEALDDYIARHS